MSIVVTGANKHDSTQVDAVLFRKIKEPAEPVAEKLCADAGYRGEKIKRSMEDFGYTPCVKSRKSEADAKKTEGFKPRLWVVEACHSWMNNFRKLRVRYEKSARSDLALCMLAAAIIALNKIVKRRWIDELSKPGCLCMTLRKRRLLIGVSILAHCVIVAMLLRIVDKAMQDESEERVVEIQELAPVEISKPVEITMEENVSDRPLSPLSETQQCSISPSHENVDVSNIAALLSSLDVSAGGVKDSQSSLKLNSAAFSIGPGFGTGIGNGFGGPPSSGVAPLGAKAEAAVNKALDWLAVSQNDDGSWGVKEETKHIYSSLAAMAFTCHSEGTASKRYGANLIAAAKILIHWSKSMVVVQSSPFANPEDGKGPADPAKNHVSPGNFHSHPLMLCALSRLYASSKVPDVRIATERASQAVATDVERGLGGDWYDRWLHYQGTTLGGKIPDSEKPEPSCGELSFSGWNCIALRTSLWTGYEFEGVAKALESTGRGVKLRFESKGGGFRLSRGDKPDLSSTGLGIVALQLLGEGNAKESVRSFDWLKRNVASLKSC